MLLTPPSVTEIYDNERIHFRVPNGYGINNIHIDVPQGLEAEGRKRANDLLLIMHPEHEYHFMTKGIEVGIKAHSYAEAISEAKKWIKLIGGSL